MTNRLSILGASCLAITMIAILAVDHKSLSASEMTTLRGGSAFASKCEQSCNAYNSFSDDCANGQVQTCYTCENGSTIVNYVDMPPICGAGGYKLDTNRTDCGKKKVGICKDYVCTDPQTLSSDCSDPLKVIDQ